MFYSLATVHVYQQSAPSLLQQLAAVTITSAMKKDSCGGKARDLSGALSAVQGASCSPSYCTCLRTGGRTENINLENYVKAVFMYFLYSKILNLYFVMVLIKVMAVE